LRRATQSVGTELEEENEIEATCRVHPYSGGAVGWFLGMVHRFRKCFLLKLVVNSRQQYGLHSARIIVNRFVITQYRVQVNPCGSMVAALVSLIWRLTTKSKQPTASSQTAIQFTTPGPSLLQAVSFHSRL